MNIEVWLCSILTLVWMSVLIFADLSEIRASTASINVNIFMASALILAGCNRWDK